jgi:hypothetical protein
MLSMQVSSLASVSLRVDDWPDQNSDQIFSMLKMLFNQMIFFIYSEVFQTFFLNVFLILKVGVIELYCENNPDFETENYKVSYRVR